MVPPRQRISHLAPFAAIAAAIGRFAPVAPESVQVMEATGGVLAADAVASGPQPPHPLAARDGWAIAAALTIDAGSYSPVPLAAPPVWVESGDAMPKGADAVLPGDGASEGAGGYEIVMPASPGEGVVPAGFHVAAGATVVAAGKRLRAADVLALGAAGCATVSLRRPRLVVLATRAAHAGTAAVVTTFIEQSGGAAFLGNLDAGDGLSLGSVGGDAVITVGGTGEGERDRLVEDMRGAGEVIFHGLGVRPGEAGALGLIGGRPVLALPGRFDAALGMWLTIGRMLMRQLTAEMPGAPPRRALTRKISSAAGLAEVVLVRESADGAEPLGTGMFAASALAAATGWVLVPPESEGYAKGTMVDVHPLP